MHCQQLTHTTDAMRHWCATRRSGRNTLPVVCSVSISPISRKAQRKQRRELNSGGSPGAPSPQSSPPAPLPGPSGPAALPGPSSDILEAFFYGRAFAITLSKRLGEAVIDLIAEASKAAAEQPQKMQEFQEEVLELANKEMEEASVPRRSSGSPGASSNGRGSSSNGRRGVATDTSQDVQALVDDLRAEIAYSRAVLQQIRTGGKSGAIPQGPAAVPVAVHNGFMGNTNEATDGPL